MKTEFAMQQERELNQNKKDRGKKPVRSGAALPCAEQGPV